MMMIRHLLKGKEATAENVNRAREQLANNPSLVSRTYKAVTEGELEEDAQEDTELFDDMFGLGIRKTNEAEIGG
jgi:hypothetical protein